MPARVGCVRLVTIRLLFNFFRNNASTPFRNGVNSKRLAKELVPV